MVNLYIKASEQVLYLEKQGNVKKYPVSTSRSGLGSEEGSFKTPLGNFIVSEKIGEGQQIYTIFKGRLPNGIWDKINKTEDLVLTRILWLSGIDPENLNTKERFIYIHGTNHEDLIGTPVSHGCVRMRNEDVIELFSLVNLNDQVIIL